MPDTPTDELSIRIAAAERRIRDIKKTCVRILEAPDVYSLETCDCVREIERMAYSAWEYLQGTDGPYRLSPASGSER